MCVCLGVQASSQDVPGQVHHEAHAVRIRDADLALGDSPPPVEVVEPGVGMDVARVQIGTVQLVVVDGSQNSELGGHGAAARLGDLEGPGAAGGVPQLDAVSGGVHGRGHRRSGAAATPADRRAGPPVPER